MRFMTCLFMVVPILSAHLARGQQPTSHRPLRAAPHPSARPWSDGPARFVDSKSGSNENDGSRAAPWRTIRHAAGQLKPGDTLYLRGGTYYENVYLALVGRPDAPITIRSHPGELAVVDGGLRDFFENFSTAWEPAAGGASDEFQSTHTYRNVRNVLGALGDSMVGMHTYHHVGDLRTDNEFWTATPGGGVAPLYCGPGLWYDRETARIHIRLAHTKLAALGDKNYRGETDPRKLPLVVAPFNSLPLLLDGAEHLRLQDLVIRGGGFNTVMIRRAKDVRLENVTVYCGTHGLRAETTGGLRITDCAFRGLVPPWAFRGEFKHSYWGEKDTRDIARLAGMILLLPEEGKMYKYPQNHDWEIAHCEFTDGHDGPYVGGVQGLRFHHNLVENLHDDGIYLSAWGHPGGDVHVFQNRIARCLTTFAFGLGRGNEATPGTGTYIYRNVIDLRAPVHYHRPGSDDPPRIETTGRLCGDHGSPTWEPMYFYHNTVVATQPARHYALGLGGHTRGTLRRLFNNIFVQGSGVPSAAFSSTDDEVQAGGNLLWSLQLDGKQADAGLRRFRDSPAFAASRARYAPGWTTGDLAADPRFESLGDATVPGDLRPAAGSPAVDAGIALPGDWPDPLRDADGRPDVGALPRGASPFRVGPRVGAGN